MNITLPGTARHCAYCGHLLVHDLVPPQRFGEPFCSETHAEEFTAGVRAARVEAVAGRERTQGQNVIVGVAGRGLQRHGQRGWTGRLQRAACWGAPILMRSMMMMQPQQGTKEPDRGKEAHDA